MMEDHLEEHLLSIFAKKKKKKNFFDTPHGKYQISLLIDEHEDLYFVKWKNDILVEMVNLSDKRKTHEKLF